MTDLSQFHFRTAVGGFHKGDVTEYISKAAQNHTLEREALQNRIGELEAEVLQLRQQLMEATLLSPESEQAPAEAHTDEPKVDISALELEAYRRAEAVERIANQRAKQVYTQLEDICRNTDEDFESAKAIVAETAQLILTQAKVLDQACVQLQEKLAATQENLRAADAMVPDPGEGLVL